MNTGIEQPRERKHRGADLILPALAVAFTVYYLISIQGTPWTAKVSAYLIGTILLALILIMAVKVGIELWRREADLGLGKLLAPREYLVRRAALAVLTIAYTMSLEFGGFTLSTAVFLYVAMILLGGWKIQRMALALALTYAIGGYLLFVVAFQTRFPRGPIESLLQAWF